MCTRVMSRDAFQSPILSWVKGDDEEPESIWFQLMI